MNLTDDDFTLFGMSQTFALDRAALDVRWRELQARVHPDKFALEGAAAQRVAMQWAVRVNEAYQRLKQPLRRAAYLCSLRGVKTGAEDGTAMPAELLMEQMAWRERLAEATQLQAVRALEVEVADEQVRLLAAVGVCLDERHDAAAAAALVRSLMFVERLRADIDRRLDALDA
jgi:molecular chaperone HscB